MLVIDWEAGAHSLGETIPVIRVLRCLRCGIILHGTGKDGGTSGSPDLLVNSDRESFAFLRAGLPHRPRVSGVVSTWRYGQLLIL